MTTEINDIVNTYSEEVKLTKVDDTRTAKSARDKDMYVLWASIPMIVRKMKDEELRSMGYPIDDPIFEKLLHSFSQNQFCSNFGMNKNAPTRWKKSDPELETRIRALSESTNVLRYEKDVDFSFTQKTIDSGDAQRVKLWKQLYRGYSEKSGLELSGKVTTIQELVTSLENGD